MKSKTQKRLEAKERQLAYDKLSLHEKVARLPKTGAIKQTAQFLRAIALKEANNA